MRSGPSWRHCCHRSVPGWAGRPRTTAGSWRRSCGWTAPARPGGTCPASAGPGRRWPAGFTAGAAGACGTGSWPACRPTPMRGASWTGWCTLWTGRWCGPTSTPLGLGAGRPRPTWARGAPADPDLPGDREALGRGRGGCSTELHLRVEGRGKPMVILATAGQRHEALMLRRLLEAGAVRRAGRGRPRLRPGAVAGDKGYSYPSLRRYLRRRGIRAVIPSKSDQPRQRGFDKAAYRERNQVERTINRLKGWRRVATRYEKRDVNYLAMVTIAAIVLLWLE